MIKILSIIILGLLLGCSESEQKKETNYKSKYNILDTSKFKDLEPNIRPIMVLSSSYVSVVTQQDICDIFESSAKENKKLEEMMTSSITKCKFYRELYEEVIPHFKTINATNVSNYFYFKYRDEYSETSLSNTIGIFSNEGKCNEFKDNFLNNDIGFTSNCKNIDSINH